MRSVQRLPILTPVARPGAPNAIAVPLTFHKTETGQGPRLCTGVWTAPDSLEGTEWRKTNRNRRDQACVGGRWHAGNRKCPQAGESEQGGRPEVKKEATAPAAPLLPASTGRGSVVQYSAMTFALPSRCRWTEQNGIRSGHVRPRGAKRWTCMQSRSRGVAA
ncbi:hypothetical protein MKX08_003649 [Trichoderma sp. CBMAI-0020]|nr:hypothetical protein MKX08_003649 [Trichoderma sp. CBMAI-0020]WOD46219.1 hypothetical protein [Trichoderma atroviride]